MFELLGEYRTYAGVAMAIVAAAVYLWPKLQSSQLKPVADTLAAKLKADVPHLEAVEKHLLALGRDPAEVVNLFDAQFAKRIEEAKAKQ